MQRSSFLFGYYLDVFSLLILVQSRVQSTGSNKIEIEFLS